ncbi:hypothetical protein ACIRBX_01345 [Kitasatospora sp. NPDC096147]|uniref:hypothetical protein n=1 Tax=Kitasatospora sp. NPDC096147 TaxID=3364093 RepID=UPI0037F91F42
MAGLAGVICLALTGCSAPGRPAAQAPAVPSPAAPTSSVRASAVPTQAAPDASAPPERTEPQLPIEAYLFSEAEADTLARAGVVLRRACLRRFGLDYAVNPTGPSTGPRSFTDRRYGLTDRAEAEANGYHLGDRDPRTHPVRPTPLSAEQQQVLTGHRPEESGPGGPELRVNGVAVPPGGCYDEAKRGLAGAGDLGPSPVAQRANLQTFKDSMAVPQVTRLFEEWSACMRNEGHAYPDPMQAMSDPRFLGDTPTPLEIRVATADVACKQRVGLVEAWSGVEAGLQKESIARQQADFATALTVKTAQLTKAAAVLREQ